MKTLPPVIAIDAGRSAVKVSYSCGGQDGQFLFPSVVAKARSLSNEQTAINARRETVEVDGVSYFVGQTAIEQTAGASYIGLSDDWTDRPEYKALVQSAMARVEQRGVQFQSPPVIVVGAPSNVFNAQRKLIAQRTKEAVGDLAVTVLPQAAGAYYSHVFGLDGTINSDRMFTSGPSSPLRNYAVVEVGHFSTDFILFINSNVNESTFQSTSGVFEAHRELDKMFKEGGIKTDAALLNDAFMHKQIYLYGTRKDVSAEVKRALESFVDKVKNKTESLYADYAQSLSGILIGGGGAKLVFDELAKVYPHATLLDNERMAVANGFLAFMKAKLMTQAAKRAA